MVTTSFLLFLQVDTVHIILVCYAIFDKSLFKMKKEKKDHTGLMDGNQRFLKRLLHIQCIICNVYLEKVKKKIGSIRNECRMFKQYT